MNSEPHTLTTLDETGRRLRTEAEHVLLKDLIRRLESDPPSNAEFCRLVNTYCELKKHDVAADKNRLAAELAIAKAAPRPAANRPAPGEPDPEAPFGRSDTGRPYTDNEFQRSLAQSVADLYGLTEPDPAQASPPDNDASPQDRTEPHQTHPRPAPRPAQAAEPTSPAARPPKGKSPHPPPR